MRLQNLLYYIFSPFRGGSASEVWGPASARWASASSAPRRRRRSFLGGGGPSFPYPRAERVPTLRPRRGGEGPASFLQTSESVAVKGAASGSTRASSKLGAGHHGGGRCPTGSSTYHCKRGEAHRPNGLLSDRVRRESERRCSRKAVSSRQVWLGPELTRGPS